ncbi:Unknown protein sequence [Pseudomonas savastanoi pv. glycinea]|uniref:Uncharacterized protein n=1 Tax=Pseudomonas savastanoi pv. glycinea TaxID=318 RepID=A0A0P9R4D1_PSESG|nr:Unknown protein sequence [Pseudomonas savastanoi pv. glycinea]KPC37039.1 Unknown protein sequence [Pseudomonas savastanoi pv. glycinea]KPC44594.1 Unknown protein sequence [Pseudomonas savastanoi pv. glycinea]KPC54349.1 Unknown protein sequence [Pseudomonas savastanoi pv. glycinea]KPX39957.1 hypothetical protein ALO37_102466 [Pseudomonas savastanoi pv. glycinea]
MYFVCFKILTPQEPLRRGVVLGAAEVEVFHFYFSGALHTFPVFIHDFH